MTGYGKAEAQLSTGKLTIEIRTLNSKSCDINLKRDILPKDKELEFRSIISSALVRGTIDVYLNWESGEGSSARQINREIALSYLQSARKIASEAGIVSDSGSDAFLLSTILRMPEVMDNKKQDLIAEQDYPIVLSALEECLEKVNDYRKTEGVALYKDVSSRVGKILDLYDQVEKCEAERKEAVRERLLKAASELEVKLDAERFEQEMIFYLEKLDINEEKVRLRQHCKYFFDTIDSEDYPGKKLGFIIQEMGREINTTGSKANHTQIQKLVVQMKDELEKIREQSMNIL